MAKAKREILKAMISHISLCPRGANQIQTMYKADDGHEENIVFDTIVKDMTEQGELLAVVYAPDMVDSQGDTASAAVIKEAAYMFGAEGKGIDIRHNEKVLSPEKAYVAESFIIQKGDPRFADTKNYEDEVVDVTGGWGVVFKIEDEDLRSKYRSGEWGGISMGGMMVATNKEDSIGVQLLKAIKGIGKKETKHKTNKSETEDMELTKENLETIAKIASDAIVAANKEAEEKAAEKLKKEQEAGDIGIKFDEPILKAGATDEDRLKYRKCLEMFEMAKTVKSKDPRARFDFDEKCKEIAKAETIEDAVAIVNKQQSSQYESYFVTNQGPETPANKAASTNDNATDLGAEIMEDMKKEKVAKTAAA